MSTMLKLRWFPRINSPRIGPQLSLYVGRRELAVRFGRTEWRLFSERYSGQFGIPKRYFYLFGGRLTFINRATGMPQSEGEGDNA